MTPPLPGAMNMAIDEALLESVRMGSAPPALRFYTWQPACLSLGHFQEAGKSADLEQIRCRGYDIVRRPTGGRAVLHDDELTYSIAAPITEVGGSVLETYLKISRGLVAGLAMMGIEADIAPVHEGTTGEKSAACFDMPSSYEIVHRGRKMIGSAQVRKGNAFLQHGSIPISVDLQAVVDTMGLPSSMVERLRARMATVGEAIADELSIDNLAHCLSIGLADTLGVELMPSELTPSERRMADELMTRYASDGHVFMR